MSSFTSVKESTSSTESYNWDSAVLGVGIGGIVDGPGGALIGGAIGAIDTLLDQEKYVEIQKDVMRAVQQISTLYVNTINQLITSSQEITLKGTGIKVHNISMKSVEDIVMTASQKNCNDNSCIDDSISNIINSLMSQLNNNITSQVSSMFSSAFQKNKKLIIYSIMFISVIVLMWLFLLLKKAATKKIK